MTALDARPEGRATLERLTRLQHHVDELSDALAGVSEHLARIDAWATTLAAVTTSGGRLLVAGNGGSAAHAQHLTAELVGRYRFDRPAFSAIALHADTSSLTAIVNDYGAAQGFARQVRAHGRAGDVLLTISTSGASPNVIAAADAARQLGLTAWALTGPGPCPIHECVDDALAVDGGNAATVQEVHQVVIHLLCESFDALVQQIEIGHG